MSDEPIERNEPPQMPPQIAALAEQHLARVQGEREVKQQLFRLEAQRTAALTAIDELQALRRDIDLRIERLGLRAQVAITQAQELRQKLSQTSEVARVPGADQPEAGTAEGGA